MSELRKIKRGVEKSKGVFAPMKCCGCHMVLKKESKASYNNQGVETGVTVTKYFVCERCGKRRLA